MPAGAAAANIVFMETTATRPRSTVGTGGWIAIAVGTVAVSVPADLFISLLLTTTCNQPADPADELNGRVAMLVVLLLAALPWVIAVPLSRDGARGVVFGVFALLPAVGFMLHSFTAGAWVGSFCLGG